MKRCTCLLLSICFVATSFGASVSKEPTAVEVIETLVQPFSHSSPFAADPDTVLLLSMHAQTDQPVNGEKIRDLSGKGNHATVVGSPKFNRHDAGCLNSIQFDEPDKLNVAHSASLDITEQITIEAWIQTTTDMGYLLLKKGSYGFPKFIANHVVFSYFHLQRLNSYPWFAITQPQATDGQWHYFAATYDGKFIRYYLDGELSKELRQVDKIRSSTSGLSIGHSEGWHNFNRKNFAGKFSSLRVSNRARSPDEIKHAMRAGKALLQGIGC